MMDGQSMRIQWYPGHMTKTRRQMEQDISQVDAGPGCGHRVCRRARRRGKAGRTRKDHRGGQSRPA